MARRYARPNDLLHRVNVMTSLEFLDHAEELVRDGRPAFARSSVSRAYYAAHHAVVLFLFDLGVRTPTDGKCHVAAFNALISTHGVDVDICSTGSDLMTLHSKRNIADYRWHNLTLEDQTQALPLVQSARQVMNALDVCSGDQDRSDNLWSHFRLWVPLHGGALGLTLV